MKAGSIQRNLSSAQVNVNINQQGANKSAQSGTSSLAQSPAQEARSVQRAAIEQQTKTNKYEATSASSSALLSGQGTKARPSVRRNLGNTGSSLSSSTQSRSVARQQPLPKAESEATVTNVGGRTVIDAGDGDDVVSVTRRSNGDINVAVNGENHRISAHDAANGITIQGGNGDDKVWVSEQVGVDLRVEGGAGNDRLQGGSGNDVIDGGTGNDVIDGQGGNDKLYGRDGNDSISGKAGNDYVEGGRGDDSISGGSGRDVLYGLDGEDTISGGSGRDYMDGGRGNDTLHGGSGIDQLMGGRGEDALFGGRGNDVLAGGHGKDRIAGGSGADTVYSQAEDRVGLGSTDTNVEVDMSTTNAAGNEIGSNVSVGANRRRENAGDPLVAADPDFQMRVESDLDALRSVPVGREVLTDIDNNAGGHSVTIEQRDNRGNVESANNSGGFRNADGTAGAGTSSRIGYNPSRISLSGADDWTDRPPIIGLFHEMIHSSDDAQGITERGVTPDGTVDGSGTPNTDPNYEQTTVGLDYDHDGDEIDGSGNLNPTPNARINRGGPSENELRETFNLERRTHY